MPLSAEQSQRIATVLGQKLKGRPCPVCGENAWGWGADLVVLQTTRYDTAQLPFPALSSILGMHRDTPLSLATSVLASQPPPAYPALPLMCNNCGNTVLLNVYVLGISDIWPALRFVKAS